MRNFMQSTRTANRFLTRLTVIRSRYYLAAITLLAGLTLLIFSSTDHKVEAQATGPTMVDPSLAVRTVATGLSQPTTMAFLNTDDFLVLEKPTGRVQRVVSGQIQAQPVLDLAVNSGSERGLLGIALHPDFATNNFVYLYWTWRGSGEGANLLLGPDTTNLSEVSLLGNRVDRFVWNGSTLTFDRNITMLRAFQADAGQPIRGNHNGGIIRFGPDGKIYIIIGDQGRRGWMQNNLRGPIPDDQFGGPEPDALHLTGVILRLNDDGSTPEDNPFFQVGHDFRAGYGTNIQKLFGYGVRNSFGMAFDPVSGKLWTAENGDDAFGEINLVEPGFNGGWVQFMGPSGRVAEFKAIEAALPPSNGLPGGELQQIRFPITRVADTVEEGAARLFVLPGSEYADPQFSWKYELSPTGIGFLDGDALGPQFKNGLFVGSAVPNLAGGFLFHFNLSGNRQSLAPDDPRLMDRVADNNAKYDITESETLLIGRDFGVITNIQTGPNGNLYIVSASRGAVYEVSAKQPDFSATLTGAEEVPALETAASGRAAFSLSDDGLRLSYRVDVSNIDNVVAGHIHIGARGTNGPVVAFLYGDAPPAGGPRNGLIARGSITAADLRGPLAGQPLSTLIDAMKAGNTYTNFHTNDGVPPTNMWPGDFPGGEIRGQNSPR